VSGVEHAVELSFDAATAEQVTALMSSLDAVGIPSLASGSPHVHPHVSVAVATTGSPEDLAMALDGLGEFASSLPALALSSLGVFVAPASVVFLGVTATEPMLALNRAVHDRLAAAGVGTRALYREGSWVPHCTLAMHVAAPSDALAALHGASLPLRAAVAGLDIVEVPTGKRRATVR
jgi:2'-5' RNA ligase